MRTFILGTDWWSDCDDVVALRLLCRKVQAGEICLAGVVINACMEHSVASVDGFLSEEGLFDVPLGIDLNGTDFEGADATRYQTRLSRYATRYRRNEDAENAVRLYRRLLSAADEPLEIIEVGFLQVAAGLLLSEADDISPLSGTELVRKKVKKFWIMAGKWDEDNGKEHNFCNNARSRYGAHIFCECCPVPVTFLGFEVGLPVISGNTLKADDVLYHAMCDHGSPNGRNSWDPMTALLAVVGDETAAGYRSVVGTAAVSEVDGSNRFMPHSDGLHRYVVKTEPDVYYQNVINAIIS